MFSQRKDKTSYSVIGAMAGSSMDGLDLAYVNFEKTGNDWNYSLGECSTIEYPNEIYKMLKNSPSQSVEVQEKLDQDFGRWIAKTVNVFKRNLSTIDLLGVHGHTVVHNPCQKISWQLGSGRLIANETQIPTVTEFRSQDVQYGGQGAPLVPFGDFTLFQEYDACLNLGGIANVSLKENKTAWDICPCNQVLNFFAEKNGKSFDTNGELAVAGNFDEPFYAKVSRLKYFSQPPPKSLPNGFIDMKVLNSTNSKDGLHTYCEVIAEQIEKSLSTANGTKLLITGGGAFNTYLVNLITQKLKNWSVEVPNQKLINFKESLIFAFLALKRFRNEINTLASVTGASKDISSGVIHLP